MLLYHPVYLADRNEIAVCSKVPGDDPHCLSALSMAEKKWLWHRPLTAELDTIAVVGDGLLATFGEGTASVWDMARGRVLRTLSTEGVGRVRVSSAIWNKQDMKVFVLGTAPQAGESDRANIVLLYDTATWQLVSFQMHPLRSSPSACDLSASSDCCLVAVGYYDGLLVLWRFPSGERVAEWRSQLEAKEMTNRITGGLSADLGYTNNVTCVAFDRTGMWLAVGYNGGELEAYDVQSRKQRLYLRGHADAHVCDRRIEFLKWSEDGTQLTSAAQDGSIAQWDTECGTCIRRTRAPRLSDVTSIIEGPTNVLLEFGRPEGETFNTVIRARNVGETTEESDIKEWRSPARKTKTCATCYYYLPCSQSSFDPPGGMARWPEDQGICNLGQRQPFTTHPGMRLELVRASKKACTQFE
jgi:WD40 repeat protein